MSLNLLSYDVFATLTQDFVACLSCRLVRLLFVHNLAFIED